MTFVELSNKIFDEAVVDYHKTDCVDQPIANPYPLKSIEYYLYLKNWIDTVQWHLEDIIRDPQIDPVEALALKRRIDKSNQDRTDLVELIDSYFWDKYHAVGTAADAKINTESPAWAIDRLSILHLKIYHMPGRSKPHRCERGAQSAVPSQTECAVGAENRPFDRHRPTAGRFRGWHEKDEGVQTDENVQRPRTEPCSLRTEIDEAHSRHTVFGVGRCGDGSACGACWRSSTPI